MEIFISASHAIYNISTCICLKLGVVKMLFTALALPIRNNQLCLTVYAAVIGAWFHHQWVAAAPHQGIIIFFSLFGG